VTALLLSAVGGTGGETCVAFTAHLLVTVESLGQSGKRGIIHTTTKTKHQVKGGLLLNIVVAKSTTVLQLLAGEDQTLLIRGDALLVLDLGLDIIDAIGRLHLEGDGLTRQSLDENLGRKVTNCG
jgi:hypothetical protein